MRDLLFIIGFDTRGGGTQHRNFAHSIDILFGKSMGKLTAARGAQKEKYIYSFGGTYTEPSPSLVA